MSTMTKRSGSFSYKWIIAIVVPIAVVVGGSILWLIWSIRRQKTIQRAKYVDRQRRRVEDYMEARNKAAQTIPERLSLKRAKPQKFEDGMPIFKRTNAHDRSSPDKKKKKKKKKKKNTRTRQKTISPDPRTPKPQRLPKNYRTPQALPNAQKRQKKGSPFAKLFKSPQSDAPLLEHPSPPSAGPTPRLTLDIRNSPFVWQSVLFFDRTRASYISTNESGSIYSQHASVDQLKGSQSSSADQKSGAERATPPSSEKSLYHFNHSPSATRKAKPAQKLGSPISSPRRYNNKNNNYNNNEPLSEAWVTPRQWSSSQKSSSSSIHSLINFRNINFPLRGGIGSIRRESSWVTLSEENSISSKARRNRILDKPLPTNPKRTSSLFNSPVAYSPPESVPVTPKSQMATGSTRSVSPPPLPFDIPLDLLTPRVPDRSPMRRLNESMEIDRDGVPILKPSRPLNVNKKPRQSSAGSTPTTPATAAELSHHTAKTSPSHTTPESNYQTPRTPGTGEWFASGYYYRSPSSPNRSKKKKKNHLSEILPQQGFRPQHSHISEETANYRLTSASSPPLSGLQRPISFYSASSESTTTKLKKAIIDEPAGYGGKPAEEEHGARTEEVKEEISITTPILYDAIYHYSPQLEDELILNRGEQVLVYKVFDDGWCFARLNMEVQHGRMLAGICPMACLRIARTI
ncbi:hypothetical protein TRVA0_008S03334 [Trichomonascus vanleenenianus]|uniref:uncharacterized protein n=1 Tax=Trichomonascus vanleenenianus TaxID=2268995 RepID=UPI003ECAFE56